MRYIIIILIATLAGCASGNLSPFASPRQARIQRIQAENSQVHVDEYSPQQSYIREAPQGELHQSPITQQDGIHIDTTPIILIALFVCITIVSLAVTSAYYFGQHKQDEKIIKELMPK